MKRTPLLFAALVPFVATAGQGMGSQKVDQQELRDDLRVTTILGSEIQGSDGQQVGTVEDVILGKDGNVVSVIVQREGSADDTMNDMQSGAEDTLASAEQSAESGMDEAESEWEDVSAGDPAEEDTDYADIGDSGPAEPEDERGGDVGFDPDRADTMEMGDEFAKLDWASVSFDAEAEVLRMSGSASSLQTVQYDQTNDVQAQDGIRASELVGMEVNLTDEDSFGEVEDVMIDSKEGKASAIVVDSMEFFDKERYALPVDLEGINAEEDELTLQYTQQQIKDMGEFDLDAMTDET